MVHTTFHQKQDMCSVHGKPKPCPCVVWHHSLSRNVTLWTIYNLTWNMTCVTHIWVNVKVFDNLRISSEFQLYEFAAALSVLKYHPSELDSDSGRVGITDLKQVSLTSLRPGPAQARSQWLVASGQIFTAPSHHGRGRATEPADWWPPSCKMDPTSERSVQWQYLSLFEWDRC